MARRAIVVTLAITATTVALPTIASAKDPKPGESVCEITDPALENLSGLAPNPNGGYYAIGDGTVDKTELAVSLLDDSCQSGEVLMAYGPDGIPLDPYDPEDLAVDGDGNVWIADTGDDLLERERIALQQVTPDGTGTVYRFSYPDGPHDAEAMLLQGDGTPIFVTKDSGEAKLFKPTGGLDAALDPNNPLPLEEAGTFKVDKTDTSGGPETIHGGELPGEPSTLVTGGAVSSDGKKAVLRTYTDAYEWEVKDGDVAASIGDGEPTVTPLPDEPQGESIAYTADGKNFVTSSEGVDGQSAQMWTYTPAKPGSGDEGKDDEADADSGEKSGSLVDWLLETFGVDGILWIVGGLGIIGLIMVIVGIRVIMRSRARRKLESERQGARDEDDYPDGYGDERYPRQAGPYDEDDRSYRSGPYEDDGYYRGGPPDDGLSGGRLFEPTGPRDDADYYDRGYDDRPRGGGNVYGGGSGGGNLYGGRPRDDGDHGGNVYGRY